MKYEVRSRKYEVGSVNNWEMGDGRWEIGIGDGNKIQEEILENNDHKLFFGSHMAMEGPRPIATCEAHRTKRDGRWEWGNGKLNMRCKQ